MIPRRIHYCMFGSPTPNTLVRRCLESWRRVLPDYELKEWNESNSPLGMPYCRAAIAARRWSRLANYVRLHALHEEGGVYLDTDVEIVRSLDPLLADTCFVAFQQREEGVDWVNNAVLGAEAGHGFLRRCIDHTVHAFESRGTLLRSPTVTTAVLREMGLERYGLQRCGEVTVLPVESFYPFAWHSTFTPDCVTEDTFGIHHWEASWHAGWALRLTHTLRRAYCSLKARMLRAGHWRC